MEWDSRFGRRIVGTSVLAMMLMTPHYSFGQEVEKTWNVVGVSEVSISGMPHLVVGHYSTAEPKSISIGAIGLADFSGSNSWSEVLSIECGNSGIVDYDIRFYPFFEGAGPTAQRQRARTFNQ